MKHPDSDKETTLTDSHSQCYTQTSQQQLNSERQRYCNFLLIVRLDDETISRWVELVLVRTDIPTRICKSANECVDYVTEQQQKTIRVILGGRSCQSIVTAIHSFAHVESIDVLCQDDMEVSKHAQWSKTFDKVQCIIADTAFCHQRLKGMEDHTNDFATLSTELTGYNNRQEVTFMFAQLLKDVFLTMESDQEEQNEFVHQCQNKYTDNEATLAQISEFRRSYRAEEAVSWYTRPIFLYGLLNRALRSHDMDMILHVRFFIRDLYVQLQCLHNDYRMSLPDSITVYRGQGMIRDDFACQIKNNVGGLLSITTFWSTSRNSNVADMFVELDPLKVAVLFKITLEANINNTPFADIARLSAIDQEEEILLPMGAIFRIASVKLLPSDNIWQVSLRLTNDDDEDLRKLRAHTFNEMNGMTSWYQVGHLMMLMGRFDTAMDIYESLLAVISPDETKGLGDLYHQMALIHEKKGDFDLAHTLYSQSLEFYRETVPADDLRLAHAYTGLGYMLQTQGHTELALENFERALAIDLCASPRNYQVIAERHSNIGMALLYQRKVSDALAKFEQALEIQLEYLPSTHGDLAITYNNISTVYTIRKDFSTALSYIEKTLFIEQKCHPSHHPSIAAAHFSVGYVLVNLKQYREALEHTQRALVIASQTLTDDHPQIIQYREQLEMLLVLEATEKSNNNRQDI